MGMLVEPGTRLCLTSLSRAVRPATSPRHLTLRAGLILLGVMSAPGCVQHRTPPMGECSRFILSENLVELSLGGRRPSAPAGITTGRLFYADQSGACVPTNETYLVEVNRSQAYPRILYGLDGHTVALEAVTLGGMPMLLARYFAGGNQYLADFFIPGDGSLIRVEGSPVASNLRSIELVGDRIRVRNEVRDDSGNRAVVEDVYVFEGGSITRSAPHVQPR